MNAQSLYRAPHGGVTPLRAAIEEKPLERVRHLVEGGWCNPMIAFEDERSAAEYAARCGRPDLVAYLGRFVSPSLRRRAEHHLRDRTRLGIEHTRVDDDCIDVLRALERVDAPELERLLAVREPATRFGDGTDKPLLTWAVENAASAAAGLLLRLGAPVDSIEQPSGWTPLITAAHVGRLDLLELLLAAGADPNHRDPWGWNALMRVAPSDRAEAPRLVEALIGAGTSLAARTHLGHTAAMIAVLHGRSKLAELLIARGVPEAGLADAQLCLACQEADLEGIERAIAAGAALEARDGDGDPAILLAARSGSAAAVEALLEHGFAASARSQSGATALHAACEAGELPLIERLIRADADLFAEDENGNTPLLCARASPSGAAVDVVQECCRQAAEAGPTEPRALAALRCLVMHGSEETSAEASGEALTWLRSMSATEAGAPAASGLLTELLDWMLRTGDETPGCVVLGLASDQLENVDAALTAVEQMPRLATDPGIRAAAGRASERNPDEITAVRLTRILVRAA